MLDTRLATLRPHALPQWNRHTCGPAALRCALLCYGDRVDGKRLAKLGGTTREEGTDESGLNEAAAEFGFELKFKHYRSVDAAFVAMRELTLALTPFLLCVDYDHEQKEFTHWISVVRGTAKYAWICDPARDEPDVIRRKTWRQLLRRLHWGLPDEISFDVYPLVPTER